MAASRSVLAASLALALLLQASGEALAQSTTTIVGGSLLNGDFNADTSTADQRSFAQTPDWVNVGTSGLQSDVATRNNQTFDGSRVAQVNDFDSRTFGLDTGYSILDGDVFNVSYFWRDSFNWNDAFDQVSVSLFTTADNTIGGARTDLGNSLSGASSINDTYEFFEQNSVYTAVPADAGKNLFVQLGGFDGAGTGGGFARVDNFMLTEGFIPPPIPGTPNAPSPLTGVNLFSDTFDRADSAASADASTAGMSSDVFTPAVGTTYTEFRGSFGSADSDIDNSRLQLGVGSGESMVGINRNFIDQEIIDAGGFAIEAIVDPSVGNNGDADNRFAAIAVGLTEANATTPTERVGSEGSNADRQLLEQGAFTFTIEDDGQYNAFDSYAKDTQAANPGIFVEVNNGGQFENAGQTNHDKASVIDDGSGLGQNDFLAQIGAEIEQDEYKVRLEFAFDAFTEGANVVVTAFIQDTQIDLDPSNGIEATPGDRDTYTFQWDGNDQNFIAFEGRPGNNDNTISFDFLMIEALATAGLAADFNGDGTVDLLDLDILGGNFGSSSATMAQGDANGDGSVDLLDLDILGSQFGEGGASTAIPEPTTLAALLAGLGLAALRRR